LKNKGDDETKSSDPEQIVSKSKDTKDISKEQKLQQLKSDLESAVVNEDYEKAALLRDEIKKLEISNLN
jgi:protein-arginine kinase activator protein McsA